MRWRGAWRGSAAVVTILFGESSPPLRSSMNSAGDSGAMSAIYSN
jgi:hypothetical protein